MTFYQSRICLPICHALVSFSALIVISPPNGSALRLPHRMALTGAGQGSKRAREIDKTSAGRRESDVMWGGSGSFESDEAFLKEILGPPIVNHKSAPSVISSTSSVSSASSFQTLHFRPSPTAPPAGHHSSIKKRRRLLPDETACLVAAFERSQRPSQEMRDQLASKLRMSHRAIQIWFQNRRAKVKRDALESGKASLSFVPNLPTSGQSLGSTASCRSITVTKAGCPTRFEEIFEMPDIDEPSTMRYESPMMVSSHSTKSSLRSLEGDFGSPTTWEDPDWTSSHWSDLPLPRENYQKLGEEGKMTSENLDWMDDFIQS